MIVTPFSSIFSRIWYSSENIGSCIRADCISVGLGIKRTGFKRVPLYSQVSFVMTFRRVIFNKFRKFVFDKILIILLRTSLRHSI